MRVLSYASNGQANSVIGKVDSSSKRLASSFEKLSSGLRINRSSDDPAGQAVAASLNAKATVSAQGTINLNDAISFYSVAQGALDAQTGITARMLELANQAANGVLTFEQRLALHAEADALTDEFNRIKDSATFNGQKLLDGTTSNLTAQAGFSAIRLQIAQELDRTVGAGTFGAAVTQNLAITSSTGDFATGDVTGDGIPDLIIGTFFNTAVDATVLVKVGTGSGTFSTTTTYTLGSSLTSTIAGLSLADVNGDGVLDIVTVGRNDAAAGEVNVLINNGSGTFATRVSYSLGASSFPQDIAIGDIDGDGRKDLVVGGDNGSGVAEVNVLRNQGSGTFGTRVSYSAGTGASSGVNSVALADINGDGLIDIVAGGDNSSGYSEVNAFINSGSGSYTARISTAVGAAAASGIRALELGDVNNDGYVDVIAGGDNDSTYGVVNVLLGNGTAAFTGTTSYTTGSASNSTVAELSLVDINGDGLLDIVTAGGNDSGDVDVSYFQSNGDGTFATRVSYTRSSSGTGAGISTLDINQDGILDIGTMDSGTYFNRFIGASAQSTSLQYVNLSTQAGAQAAIATLQSASDRINNELGVVGSNLTRLSTAFENLSATRVGYQAAASTITDVDVAEEVAIMTRETILQQSSTALLAQANQTPEILLKLLS